MSVISGNGQVTDQLVFSIDAGSNGSYNRTDNQRTLINTNSWTVGTGSVSGFSLNGRSDENNRLYDTDPYGNQGLVWQSNPIDGDADGGWEGSSFSIDRGRLYRSCVWIRRVGSATAGTSYHGLHTNGSGDTIHLSDSATNTNPYWDYRGTSWFPQNEWFLFVGHIYPAGTTRTTPHPDSGIYNTSGVKIAANSGNVPNDVRFPTDATTAYQRVYHYYSGNSNSDIQFAYPRWDLVDGTEPSIADLCRFLHNGMYAAGPGTVSPPYNQPTWSSAGGGSWAFNGSNQYFFYPNSTELDTQNLTVSVWIKTNATNQNGFFFEKGLVNSQYALFQEGNQIQWRMGANGDAISYNWQSIANTTEWFNITATFTSGSQVMYINGAQVATGSQSSTLATTTYGMNIGRHSGGYYFNGNIAQVKVYRKVLTAAEVLRNFNASRARFGR